MLQVRERRHHQIKALALTGQFNRRNLTGIKALILMAQEKSYNHIVLDFSGVTEIDSSSLSELFLWYHNRKPWHVQISVVKPQPYIQYHKDWSHLSEIVSIFRSSEEAMDYATS